jgi:hypothetical protein
MSFRNQNGFTFNELLAAMGLIVFAILAYSVSSFNLIRHQVGNDSSTVAIHLAQDKIEELQARPNLSDENSCADGGERGLSAKSGVRGIFDRCWRIAASELGPGLKRVDVTVSWRDHEARDLTLSTLVFEGE